MLEFRDQSGLLPQFIPPDSAAPRNTLRLSFGNQFAELILGMKALKEYLLLAGGGDGRYKFGAVAGNELVSRSHVEDKLAADKFGGGIIGVGTDE